MHRQTPPIASGGIATRAELEYQQLMSSTAASAETIINRDENLEKHGAAAPSSITVKTPPLASGGLATLAGLMDKFKQVLSPVMDNSDDQPATLKVIDKMMHTVISYEQGKERLEHSRQALKIKEASQQRNAGKQNININNNNAAEDDVSLIIPQKTHDRNGQITPDNPKTCPVEMLAPGFEEGLVSVKGPERQQDTAAVAGDVPGPGFG